ncbi:MAG TPA: helix-turn-helix domain-containing protein [Polyangiaceae bacterium]
MQRKSFAAMECAIARAIDQMGDGWTLLIVRNALLGARRFQDFEKTLAIPPNTLSRRLDTLIEHGIVERRLYEERPPREEYWLTEKGQGLASVLLAFAAWGNRWLAPDGAFIECADAATGRRIDPIVVDRKTRRELLPGRVALRAGPGASARLRAALRRPVLFGCAQAGAGGSP